jgi:hypothetical protein
MRIHPTYPALNKPILKWYLPGDLALYVQLAMPITLVATGSFRWTAGVGIALWAIFFALTYRDAHWITLRWRALKRSATLSPVTATRKDAHRIMHV